MHHVVFFKIIILSSMTRRIYERDAVLIEKAGDLDGLVKTKELIKS